MENSDSGVEGILQEQVDYIQRQLGDLDMERHRLLKSLRGHEAYLCTLRAAIRQHPELAGTTQLLQGLEEAHIEWLSQTGLADQQWLLRSTGTRARAAALLRQQPEMTWGEMERLLWLRKKAEYRAEHV